MSDGTTLMLDDAIIVIIDIVDAVDDVLNAITFLFVAEPSPAAPGGHFKRCLHGKHMTCTCSHCKALVDKCVRCTKAKARKKERDRTDSLRMKRSLSKGHR